MRRTITTAGLALGLSLLSVSAVKADDMNCYDTVGSTVCVAPDDPANERLGQMEAEYTEAFDPNVSITLPPASNSEPAPPGDVEQMAPGLIEGTSDMAPGDPVVNPQVVYTPPPETIAPPEGEIVSVPYVDYDVETVVIEPLRSNPKR